MLEALLSSYKDLPQEEQDELDTTWRNATLATCPFCNHCLKYNRSLVLHLDHHYKQNPGYAEARATLLIPPEAKKAKGREHSAKSRESEAGFVWRGISIWQR